MLLSNDRTKTPRPSPITVNPENSFIPPPKHGTILLECLFHAFPRFGSFYKNTPFDFDLSFVLLSSRRISKSPSGSELNLIPPATPLL